MSNNARILKELKEFEKEDLPNIKVSLYSENIRHYKALIGGPANTPYENGEFEVEVYLPDNYPDVPPKAIFKTKIFHPNIDRLGRICLDVLKEDHWSPALNLRIVLLAIQSLMGNAEINDSLNNEAAEYWKLDPEAAFKKALQWTQLYATKSQN